MENFTNRNRQRIRYLLIVARPLGISYQPGNVVDDALWHSFLPHLKRLQIVVSPPVKGGDYENGPTFEQDMDRWLTWLRLFLQCFGRHLSEQTKVEIDDDGRAETRALVKDCLPRNYQEIRRNVASRLTLETTMSLWDSRY